MSETSNKINCPQCGSSIDVNDILHHQIENQLKKQYGEAVAQEKAKYAAQAVALKTQRAVLEADKAQQKEAIAQQVSDEVRKKEQALKKKITAQAVEEQSAAFNALREELNEKSHKIKTLNQASVELEKIKREKDELEDKIKAEAAQAFSQQLIEEKEKIQKAEDDKQALKFKALEKQLDDQKKLTQEMKRKQEQGSMQMQGEVQELAIEAWLAEKFPLDTIDDIKKGAMGADCLQTVHTRTRQNCGTIYYESKRTKVFQANWIEKFKADIRDKNANIGVLVTEAMPANMTRLGLKDGVWICSLDEFKGLCTVLRESLIQLSTAMIAQDNKGDKMGMLYDFLTSNAFKLQIEAIVEGFTQMKTDLESEQRSMRGIWKKREKQIEKVFINTTDMYGSIKGIAGSAVQPVALLELPEGDVDAEE